MGQIHWWSDTLLTYTSVRKVSILSRKTFLIKEKRFISKRHNKNYQGQRVLQRDKCIKRKCTQNKCDSDKQLLSAYYRYHVWIKQNDLTVFSHNQIFNTCIKSKENSKLLLSTFKNKFIIEVCLKLQCRKKIIANKVFRIFHPIIQEDLRIPKYFKNNNRKWSHIRKPPPKACSYCSTS